MFETGTGGERGIRPQNAPPYKRLHTRLGYAEGGKTHMASRILVIDAYNALHVEGVLAPESAGLELDSLASLISRSRYAADDVWLVCDAMPRASVRKEVPLAQTDGPCGSRVPGLQVPCGGARILYAGHGRSADSAIEVIVRTVTAPRRVLVVSSDHAVQKTARKRGCRAIDSSEFIGHLAFDSRSTPRPSPGRLSAPLSSEEVEEWVSHFGVGTTAPTERPSRAANLPTMEFGGCYTAIVTPFTADGSAVDSRRLKEQIAAQAAGGVRGIVPCGTTGEAPTLSEAEHELVVRTAIEAARPHRLQVIAGAGSNNTAHAVHLHRLAHSLGADASLQVSPYYNKPSQEGLYRHFMAIADSCELPVVLYNIPGRSAVAIAPATIERLAAHSHIRAIKEATGSIDSASEIRQRCGITILSGDDTLTPAFAAVGATGVVSVLSNLLPARVQSLCDALNSNDLARARTIHEALFPLAKELLTLDTNPIPVKTAMALLGLDSGALRLPMCPPSPAALEQIRSLVKRILKPAAAPPATPSRRGSRAGAQG